MLRLSAVPALLVLLWLSLVQAQAAEVPVRIGVLAYRDIAATAQAWQPTAAYLDQNVPGHRFSIVPLHNVELEQAVKDGQVDFILTQPEQYVMLRNRFGLAAMATLMPLAEKRPMLEFGGVIFSRADNAAVKTLEDVRGRKVAGVYENSLGAFRIQQWTLLKAGIHLPGDVKALVFTGQPQDNVVKAVMEGKVDVGFVRTGVLESMAREGRLDLARVHVLNSQQGPDFPLRLSTSLLPEWPFASRRGVPEKLAKAVSLALLKLPADSPAAIGGKYYGFAPPGDYTPIEAILLRLKTDPGRLERFDAQDVAEKYWWEIHLLLSLLLLLAGTVAWRLQRNNRLIAKAAQERDLLLGSLAEGVCGFNHDGHCNFINNAALQMLGFQREQVVKRARHPMFDFLDTGSKDLWDAACPLRGTLLDGRQRVGEALVMRADDNRLPVQYSITPMRDNGQVVGIVVVFQDISERKRQDADQRVAAVAFETQEGMIITDENARILRVNQAFSEMTGYSAQEVVGQTPSILKSGRQDAAFYQALWQDLKEDGYWQGEIWNRRKNGENYPEWLTITVVRGADGKILHYVGTFLDISHRKKAEAQIEYMALYDILTGLPNRRLLLERLNQAVLSRARANKYGALLFIDLDNFKTLNDTQGHDMGDRLLIQTAERLAACVREEDTVARLGGDEFIVMLDELGEEAEQAAVLAEIVGEKILAALNQPYRLDEGEHHSSASIGITLFHSHDNSVEELLKRADLAMYQAKSTGRNNLNFFDPAMQAAVESRASLEKEIRGGLKRREFLVYYQPQVDGEGRIQGVEALARWQHPQRGLLSPGVFIDLAEATGLILSLGQQVLEIACDQLAVWQADAATRHLSISVNVSARQFRQADFVERVIGALKHAGADPVGLKLELTESMMLEGVDGVIAKMQALKQHGVVFSLDDFGTGYSSLAYLKRLPLDQIKIDQSFVRDALQDNNDATITRTVLALGETFGLAVIAEGVETVAQHQFLEQHGCKAFQGYLFGKPLPIETLTELLRDNGAVA
jgi:diguanylate cyclase (GGDEF)-like protein/PAS domain S-box-containing protein